MLHHPFNTNFLAVIMIKPLGLWLGVWEWTLFLMPCINSGDLNCLTSVHHSWSMTLRPTQPPHPQSFRTVLPNPYILCMELCIFLGCQELCAHLLQLLSCFTQLTAQLADHTTLPTAWRTEITLTSLTFSLTDGLKQRWTDWLLRLSISGKEGDSVDEVFCREDE